MSRLITTESVTKHTNFYIWGDTNTTSILMRLGVLEVQGQSGSRILDVDGQWA